MSARFAFPFWGHAASTSAELAVYVWFAAEPTASERAAIVHELGRAVAFWDEPVAADPPGSWSGPVLAHSRILDRQRKHVPDTHALVAPVLARLDRALYAVSPETLSEPHRVGLSFHAGVEQRLQALHARFPIALAVREAAPRDRFTAWHAWSLDQLPAILPRLQAASTWPVSALADDEPAPWRAALVALTRYQLAKEGGARLAAADRAAFASLLARAAAGTRAPHATVADDERRGDDESGRALLAFADKLAPRHATTPASADPDAVLAQILREAAQLEFTRIKLSECPTYVALAKRGPSDVQCAVVIAAVGQSMRHLERLYGQPGAIVLSFDARDQQELDVREHVMRQLLRKKLLFSTAQAARLMRLLAGAQNALVSSWLPLELLLERLRASLLPALDDPDVQRAHRELLAAPHAFQRTGVPTRYKSLVDALLNPATE